MARPVFVAWLLACSVAYADPAAEEHHTRGKRFLTEDKDYAAAEAEFAAAYALDRDPRYLFNLALAQRLGGKCQQAIASYRAFLETQPAEAYARNARAGIELCERLVPNEAVAPRCGDGKLAELEACDDGNAAGADGCSACIVDTDWSCAGQPSRCTKIAVPVPAVVVETREPWYRDRAGNALAITGGVAIVTGVALYIYARGEASATFDPGPLADYEQHRDRAALLETVAWITGGAGLALVGGAVIRYATRSAPVVRERRITVAPAPSGLAIGGTW